jgi:hypothetical protein
MQVKTHLQSVLRKIMKLRIEGTTVSTVSKHQFKK